MMKEALVQENGNNYPYNTGYNSSHPGGMLFTTSNPNVSKPLFSTTNSVKLFDNTKPNKLFITVKNKKIFNIVKDPIPNNRRKSVRIIYKNEDDYSSNDIHRNYEYQYDDDMRLKNDGYDDMRELQYENEMEQVNEEEPEPEINEEEEFNGSVKNEAHHSIFESNYTSFFNIFK